jgi:glutathione S-transferase
VPKITLYGYRDVPFTEKCRRALVLKGLPFELCEPADDEDVKRLSPKTGLLPVMTVDGELVSDSTNILLRLEEIAPVPPLVSSDPVTAAQQRSLEDWADESFLWYFQQWRRIRSELPSATPPQAARRWSRRASPAPTVPPPVAELVRGVVARLDDLVRLLGQRPFFYAEQVSMADLTIYAMLETMGRDTIPGAAAGIQARPVLVEYMRRVEAATGG